MNSNSKLQQLTKDDFSVSGPTAKQIELALRRGHHERAKAFRLAFTHIHDWVLSNSINELHTLIKRLMCSVLKPDQAVDAQSKCSNLNQMGRTL